MAVDAGDILSSWMQGSNFVNNNIARVEEERRRQELEETQRVAGKVANMFAPKFDANGKPIARSMGDLFNDPEALELVNHPFMRDVRMQGITDPEVEDVQIVAGVPLPDGARAIPVMEQRFKDGHVSRGPLTADRSRNPDARVVSLDRNDAFNHLAAAVYARSPDLGKELMNRAHQQSMGALQTLYRNAPTQEERNQILAAGQSYGMLADEIIKGAAAPVTLQDASGIVTTKGPDGSTTVSRDPTVFERVGRPAYEAETDLAVGRKQRLADVDLAIKTAQAPQERVLHAGNVRSDAEVRNEVAGKYAPVETQREVTRQTALAEAKHEIELHQNAQEGLIFDQAVANIGSGDPKREANGLRDLGRLVPDTTVREKVAREAKARGLLINNIDQTLSNGLSNFDKALEQGIGSLNQSEADGLYAGLVRRSQEAEGRGDKAEALRLGVAARHVQQAILGPRGEAGAGQKAETFKPEDFDKDGVRRFITSDVPEEIRNKIDLNGAVVFNQTLEQLNALGIPVAKNSANGARLNRAVADSAILQEVAGLGNTAPALYNRENLIPKYGEASTGSPEEFSKDLVLPLGKRMQELKVSTDPKNVIEATEDAVALRSMGIPLDQAVDWAARLGDPAYGNQIASEAQQAGAKTMDEVRAFIAAKIKTAPKPTVAERVRGLDRYDPAPALQQLPSQIVSGLRGAVQPPPPGPSEGQNRYKVR